MDNSNFDEVLKKNKSIMDKLYGQIALYSKYEVTPDGALSCFSRSEEYGYDGTLLERGEWKETGFKIFFPKKKMSFFGKMKNMMSKLRDILPLGS